MKVIVRDEKAGVYYGEIESRDGVHSWLVAGLENEYRRL